MISNFREGGVGFQKSEGPYVKSLQYRRKIGDRGRGVKSDFKKSDIIYGRPLTRTLIVNFKMGIEMS